jgi:hypothetical protein
VIVLFCISRKRCDSGNILKLPRTINICSYFITKIEGKVIVVIVIVIIV